MLNSPFRYPGGKSKAAVRAKLLSYMPYKTKEYREAFVGGGGLFFGLQPAKVERRWINDINPHLISVYEAFRDDSEAFLSLCREIEPARPTEPCVPTTEGSKGAVYNQRLGEFFKKCAKNDVTSQALRYFFINRTVWAGRVNYDPKMKSRMYYSNPEGWNITERHGFLEAVAAHLQGTRITTGSYEPLLQEPGTAVWVYLDPPYVVDTEFNPTDKLYEFGFSKEDHIKLAQACGASKHKICISYDNHPLVHELYKKEDGWFIYQEEWTYSGAKKRGTKKGQTTDVKKKGQELVVTNYERPGEQSDMFAIWDEAEEAYSQHTGLGPFGFVP